MCSTQRITLFCFAADGDGILISYPIRIVSAVCMTCTFNDNDTLINQYGLLIESCLRVISVLLLHDVVQL